MVRSPITVSAEEAATALGIHPATLRRKVASGAYRIAAVVPAKRGRNGHSARYLKRDITALKRAAA